MINTVGQRIGLHYMSLLLLLILAQPFYVFAEGPELFLKDVQCPQSLALNVPISWEAQWSRMGPETTVNFRAVDGLGKALFSKEAVVSANGSRRWSATLDVPANMTVAGNFFALEARWKGASGWQTTSDKSWRVICSYPSVVMAEPITSVVTPVVAPVQASSSPSSQTDLLPLIIIGASTLLTLAAIAARRRPARGRLPRKRRNVFSHAK